jgi:hypothetical protein
MTISNIALRYLKQNTATVDANRGAAETVTLAASGPNSLAVMGYASATSTPTFSAGNYAGGYPFNMTVAGGSQSVTVTVRGKSASVSGMTINPAAASSIAVSGLAGSTTAGASLPPSGSITVTIRDAFSNVTTSGCGNLVVSGGLTSAGGHGGTATAPVFPAAFAQNGGTGIYTIGTGSPIILYGAGTNNLSFDACGLTSPQSVTISNNATVNAIWLNSTNSEPGSHQSSITCSAGTTVSCSLYSWAWDAYGNEFSNDTWSCPAWSYTDTNSNTGWTLSPASGHTTSLTTSTKHIEGNVTCTAGAKTGVSSVFGKITKNLGFSCANWACTGTSPTSACTLTNSSGYNTASSAFSSSDAAHNSFASTCDGALNTGNSCIVAMTGSTGFPSGTLTANPAEAQSANVLMPDITTSVQSGSNAPNCTNTLATAVTTAWFCDGTTHQGKSVITVTNNHAFSAASFPASSTTFTPTNGFVMSANTCESSGAAAAGGTCTATITNPSGGQTTSLAFNPSGGFFQSASQGISASPSCSQAVTKAASVQTSCSGTNGSLILHFTVTNDLNTLKTFTVGAVNVTGSGSRSVINNTCSGSIAPSGSCAFDVSYTSTPSTNDIGVSVTATDGYFNNVSFGTGDISNACP